MVALSDHFEMLPAAGSPFDGQGTMKINRLCLQQAFQRCLQKMIEDEETIDADTTHHTEEQGTGDTLFVNETAARRHGLSIQQTGEDLLDDYLEGADEETRRAYEEFYAGLTATQKATFGLFAQKKDM
ncbi:hypothetical protein HYZ99_03220 [Candidatus Peregrinibacteria bacterium]|nr:hypothetical protein [Candidatus Peregrinibacteria bacterium]